MNSKRLFSLLIAFSLLGITMNIRKGEIVSAFQSLHADSATCNVRDFGAKGDGFSDDSSAINAAIDACANQGGGIVLLPRPGIYRADQITLKSNITLKLDGIDMDDVVIKGLDTGNGPIINSIGTYNVGIEGPGTIDRGLGGRYVDEPYYEEWQKDIIIVHFKECTKVHLKDILITSEDYDRHYIGDHLVNANSIDITYDHVIIHANQDNSTNDGMQIIDGCRDVTIINSEIFAGDDGLVFHGDVAWDSNGDGDSGNDFVLVQDVYIDGQHVQGGIMMTTAGSANDPNSSHQTNITFDNVYIEDAMSEYGWGVGIRLSPRGPNVKYENVTFSNITMHGDVPQPFRGITSY